MDPFKVILTFALKFLGVYIGCMVLFTIVGIDKMARDTYAGIGESIYKNWSDEVEIHVKAEDGEAGNDLLFQIVDKQKLEAMRNELRKNGKSKQQLKSLAFATNSRTTFLMPIIFFLALIIAYPSNIKHRFIALLLGVLPLLGYMFFKLGCMLFYAIDESVEYFPDYNLSSFANGFLYVVDSLFIEAAYIMVVVIWIMVCVRKRDFKELLAV